MYKSRCNAPFIAQRLTPAKATKATILKLIRHFVPYAIFLCTSPIHFLLSYRFLLDTKEAWELPIVYSTNQDASIACCSRTDNVRAHADMNYIHYPTPAQTSEVAPKRVQLWLAGFWDRDINHTRDIYRCYA